VALTFFLFVKPAIRKMLGLSEEPRKSIRAKVTDRIDNRDHRRVFSRAVLIDGPDGYVVQLAGSQGSGVLTSMWRANSLIVTPEHVAQVNPGDEVEVWPI
jgi:molybdopterin molybdotransferase